MQINFVPFVERMEDKYEGGYCWDKGDPGGPTNHGITCYDLAEERHQPMTSMAAWAPIVKAMPRSEADQIYGTKYKGDFDALPSGPDCAEFDYKVNSGIGRVALVRPRILKLAGRATVQDCDPKWYVDAICQERAVFLEGLAQRKPQFRNGWLARVADLKQYCDHLAAAGDPAKGPPVSGAVTPAPKATHTDPNLNTHVTATVTAHGTAVGTALSQGLPIRYAVVAGLVGVVGIIGWAAWRAQRNEALNQTVILPATIPPHP